jgi:hypothetical protein
MKYYAKQTAKALGTGLVFFIGTMAGSLLALALGLPAPAVPEGTDGGTLLAYLLGASLATGALLAFLAGRIRGGWLRRGLTLAWLGWMVYSLNTFLEAAIFTTFESASPYKLVMDLVGFALAGTLAALWFRPAARTAAPPSFSLRGWAARLALAWAAFPLIYLTFGKLVEPFVIDVYQQGQLEMRAPGWDVIIPMQLARSLLFLLACLPLVRAWGGARRSLWAGLGAALFLLVGGLYMFQAYWMPVGFRLAHTLEILADSLVYAGVLAALFGAAASPSIVRPAAPAAIPTAKPQ